MMVDWTSFYITYNYGFITDYPQDNSTMHANTSRGGGAHRNCLPVISVVPFVALSAYAIHEQNKALSDLRDGDSRIVNICHIPVDGLVLSSRCMPVGSEKGGMK